MTRHVANFPELGVVNDLSLTSVTSRPKQIRSKSRMTRSRCRVIWAYTREAGIRRFEVHGELVGTRSVAEQVTVWYEDVAECLAGALTTDVVHNICLTTQCVSEIISQTIGLNAAADAHTTKRRRLDDDNIVLTATTRTKRLQLAVLASPLYNTHTFCFILSVSSPMIMCSQLKPTSMFCHCL